jgi:hypothetical protein
LPIRSNETVEYGFLPWLSGRLRQLKDRTKHRRASAEGGAVEFAGFADQQRAFWVGSVRVAFEAVERFVARGLGGDGVLHQDCQRG